MPLTRKDWYNKACVLFSVDSARCMKGVFN
nr:MAG TPA: hypothetical protein [Caudoviricetes sp.]DAQ67691.1 MAG TPA: hypothetical protein [Caudoviricetes sp.]DAZ31726.1 MAG TPA: hypothetical protein [Caudoviricetes sp.]